MYKLLQPWTPDFNAKYRDIFYLGENRHKISMNSMDHSPITDLKQLGFDIKYRNKIQGEHFLKFLIEQNAQKNSITYVMNFALSVYPWYDSGPELKDIIESFSSVQGFDNLKWRFANTWDLYCMEEEQDRLNWFLESTSKLKQENIIMDLVNFDIVDLYKEHLPKADINYKSVYFSNLVLCNMRGRDVYKPTLDKREKHVLTFNNIVKTHRNAIVDLCAEHDDKTLYSYIGRDILLDSEEWELWDKNYTAGPHMGLLWRPPYKLINSAYTLISTETFFEDDKTYNFDDTHRRSAFDRSQNWELADDFEGKYRESVVLNKNVKYAYITEKSLKSAFFKLPMIICGLQGSLKTWHRLGFESFPEFFDEQYDTITNADERLEKVKSEILKIINMDTNDLHELYHSKIVQEKLEHNQQQFFKHYLNDFKYHTFNYKQNVHPLMDKIMEQTDA